MFLSEIRYRRVLEPSGEVAGRLADLVVVPEGGAQVVRWAILAVPDGTRALGWSELIAEVTHYRLRHSTVSLPVLHAPASGMWLARDLFDAALRERGAGTHTVSDVHIVENGGQLRLTGVDVGRLGLWRRVGAAGIARRLGAKERLIPWSAIER